MTSIIKTKLIATYFGPSGIGIYTFYQNFQQLSVTALGFGIPYIGIKSLTKNEEKESRRIDYIILNIFLGIISTLLTIFFSHFLLPVNQKLSTLNNILIGTSIGMIIIYNGLLTVIQAESKINSISKVNIVSNLLSLFVSIPIIYFKHYQAIFLILFIQSFISLIIILTINFNSFKYKYVIKLTNIITLFNYCKSTLRQGIYYAFTSSLGFLVPFIMRSYLINRGSILDAGFYGALYQIVFAYTGILFGVMATDFFPRISKLNNISEISAVTNFQIRMIISFFMPIMAIYISFNDLIIKLLFSDSFKFLKVPSIIAGLSNILKTFSWVYAYIIISKSTPKKYLIIELIGGFISVFLGIIFYEFYSFEGIAISFVISNFFYLLIIFFSLYNFKELRIDNNNRFLFLISIITYIGLSILNITSPEIKYTHIINFIVLSFSFINLLNFLIDQSKTNNN